MPELPSGTVTFLFTDVEGSTRLWQEHLPVMKEAWVLEILDRCPATGVPFFFKQWRGAQKKRTGRLLQGCPWDKMPTRT